MNTNKALPIIDPKTPFQAEFEPVIDELKRYVAGGLGANLHSLYLFGSVARKTARIAHSNIDVVVVTQQPLSEKSTSLINTIKWRFAREYPQITGVSFQFGELSDVLSLEGIFTWGFMLRHCCVCVKGDDLSERFGEFEPSWEIAKHWNMDVEDWLSVYRNKIVRSDNLEAQLKSQKLIAKKLLRASYSLVMHKDKQWIENPIECGKVFLRYYPKKKVEIQRLVILLSGKPVPKRSVIGVLDGFGEWLVKAYQKTEFRIG